MHVKLDLARPVVIRDSVEADLEAIAAIYDAHVQTGTASFEEEPPGAIEMAARRQRIVERGWPWLVAERQGEVLGYAYVGLFRDRSAYRFTAEDSVYIRPDSQGQGLGRALLAPLLDRTEAAGFRELIAVIGDSRNTASVRLHSAFGFAMVGTLREVGLKFGQRLDVVLMQRSFG